MTYSDSISNLINDTHVLVTKDDAGLGSGAPLVHVKVTARDRKPHQCRS